MNELQTARTTPSSATAAGQEKPARRAVNVVRFKPANADQTAFEPTH
jgi:hypothetical protein